MRLAYRLVTPPADAEGSRPGFSTVIHFSTATPVHSCVVVDQLIYLNHPQGYTQGVSLAGPGLA